MFKGIGREFMEKTQPFDFEESAQAKGMPQPPFEKEPEGVKAIIDLPQPSNINVNGISLREAIESRRSIRKYSGEPVKLEELSYLLWCTQGVQKVVSDKTLRTVPSAGGRHPFETYLLVNNVEGLTPGLYRYMAINHKLALLESEDNITDKITNVCPKGPFIKTSAVTFIWTAVIYRMSWRHGERGYRYIHLDAGHICQNLYLASESVGCGTCAVAVFEDDKINSLLKIDGREHFTVYMATVGKR